MKTIIYAQIYNPNSADMIYKMRKENINMETFLNSDIFATALETSAKIYMQSKI